MLPVASEIVDDIRATTRRALGATAIGGGGDDLDDVLPVARAQWRTLTEELGIGGLVVPEEMGGLGVGLLELSGVMQEAGRALTPAPVLSSCGIATRLLLVAGGDARPWLDRLLQGAIATVAFVGEDEDWFEDPSDLAVHEGAERPRLSGRLPFVLDLELADFVIVPVRTAAGTSVLVVEAEDPGVSIRRQTTMDLSRGQGVLDLEGATASLLVGPDRGSATMAELRTHACVALAAEQLGAAQAALDLAVGYAQERHQFGRPIGSFQAIKHACADMLVGVEKTRSLVDHAIWALDENRPDAAIIASATQAVASETLRDVALACVQVHGGIGFTWEHDAHRYVRRGKASEVHLGLPHKHRQRVSDHLARDIRS